MGRAKRSLKTLRSRLEHLEGRVAGQPLEMYSFMRAEIGALRWALGKLAPFEALEDIQEQEVKPE